MQSPLTEKGWSWPHIVCVMAALTMGVLAWSLLAWYLASLADEMDKNPLYSHGYLVAVFAVVLLWIRRDLMPKVPLRPSWWALWVFLMVGGVMRLGAAYFSISTLARPCLAVVHAVRGGLGDGWLGRRPVDVAVHPFPDFRSDSLSRLRGKRPHSAAAPAIIIH